MVEFNYEVDYARTYYFYGESGERRLGKNEKAFSQE